MTRNINAAAPFMSRLFSYPNGRHPLLDQLILQTRAATFRASDVDQLYPDSLALAYAEALLLEGDLTDILADATRRQNRKMIIKDDTIASFINTRNLMCQSVVPPDCNLVFHHTIPLTFGQQPWFIHIENVTTLFSPQLRHGHTNAIALYDQPIFYIIKHLLEQDSCRAIFTHMRLTHHAVQNIFRSDLIAAKTRYAPLGLHVSLDERALIDQATFVKAAGQPKLELLFTNSWHQEPANFFARGGLEVFSAILKVLQTDQAVHLTVRSAIPDSVRVSDLGKAVLSNPAVTILDQPVSDHDILALFRRADIFLLPSAALHSISVLRAMEAGAVCIACDVPALREFIDPEQTGILLPERAATIYSTDPESGWEQDNYSGLCRLDEKLADALAQAILKLGRDRTYRQNLARNAQEACKHRFRFDAFLSGFDDIIQTATA